MGSANGSPAVSSTTYTPPACEKRSVSVRTKQDTVVVDYTDTESHGINLITYWLYETNWLAMESQGDCK